MTFGGESKCPFAHFPLLAYSFIHLFVILMSTIFEFLYARGSPNIEMDEHTFLVNRERAVDYLNSLDKVTFYSNLIYFANAYAFLFGLH